MDTLMHNPIADMYGPTFLLFYSIVIAITLDVCWRSMEDPSKNEPLPLIPTEPDPYEIAYLRGGESEVMQLAVFNLIQRGYLQVNEKSIQQAPDCPDQRQLMPQENELFVWFSTPRTASDMEMEKLFLASAKNNCGVYRQHLQDQQLLFADKWHAANVKVALIGTIVILSLGGYKLQVALAKGHHNVEFLIVLAVVSIIFLFGLLTTSKQRLSERGRNYLSRLQQTFEQLKQKVKTDVPSVFDYDLLVALFGVSVLTGTTYDSYQKVFQPKPSTKQTSTSVSRNRSSSGSSCSSSSSCGTSCGSSCSSSSSCGSSCGGGCGGCGGCGG